MFKDLLRFIFLCVFILRVLLICKLIENYINILVYREEKRNENFYARERFRYFNGSDYFV